MTGGEQDVFSRPSFTGVPALVRSPVFQSAMVFQEAFSQAMRSLRDRQAAAPMEGMSYTESAGLRFEELPLLGAVTLIEDAAEFRKSFRRFEGDQLNGWSER